MKRRRQKQSTLVPINELIAATQAELHAIADEEYDLLRSVAVWQEDEL